MTPDMIERAAKMLCDARRGNYQLDGLPADCRPKNVEEGNAIAERLLALYGEETVGYFLGFTNPDLQKMRKVPEPYYARVLKSNLQRSPVRFISKDFLTMGLECEVAFRVGQDLPVRSAPYSQDQVAAAVAAMLPAVDVVSAHFRNWPNIDVPTMAADNGADGPIVCGLERADWRSIDRVSLPVVLMINGRKVSEGRGAKALGDPLAALTWLANALSKRGGGLKAGDVITTGTTTGVYMAKAGDEAVAQLGELGEVRITFA